MELRTLANAPAAARPGLSLIAQGPSPAYAGYKVSLGDIDVKISAALSLSGYTTYERWDAGGTDDLIDAVGTAGKHAIILNDPGTHTDPVVGGTVQNTGIYKWSTSPAGWKRIADTQALAAQEVLNDPGFALVADDLALGAGSSIAKVAANETNINTVAARDAAIATVAARDAAIGTVAARDADIGTVAARDADIATVVANIADIQAAPGAAADAVAAASSVVRQAPAYANTGGQGDRTATITVTATAGLILGGTTSNLVDGATANNTTDSITFVSSAAASGKEITFDFGDGASKVVTEATFKQSTNATHGTWKFQVSNDNGARVDIGSSFTLGGSTSQVLTQLAANVLGYRYLHLVGVSGTVSGSPFIQEVEFKIAATDSDGKPVVPTGGGARAVLAKTGSSTRAWRNLDLLDGFPTTGLQSDWEMITDDGVSVRDRYGNNDITLSAGTNISRRAGFLSTAGGKVQTPSFTSVTTVVALVRLPRYAFGDSARSGFIISLSANGGVGLQEGVAGAGSTIYVGGMQGGVHAPPFDGNAHKGIETGHWRLVFYSPSAAQTGPIGFGGRATMTSSTCAEFDVMRASVFTGSALTDDQRTAIFQSYRRTALKYGVALTVNDCREIADFVADTGESNCDGRADIADLSAADQALRLPDTLIMSANRTTFMRSLQELQIGVNEQVTAPTVDFGPAFGLAKACRGDAINRRRRLIIGKCGVGGSRIAPSSVGGTASTTWSPTEILGQGIIWRALEHMYATQAQALARGIGPKFAGLGLATGLNDAVSTAYASSDVVYQGYLQAFYDFWVTYGVAPATGYKAALFRPLTSDPASNPTALANIRSACGLFAAAQSGVTNIDTDAYTKEPDNVHWDAVSMVGSAGPSYKSALAL